MSSEKLSAMIPKGQPFEFEGLDVRPGFRANDGGAHTYTANFMITEEMWNAIKTIPRHRMIKGILLWYDDDADLARDAKPAAEPDPFAGVAEAYPDDGGPARPLPLPPKEPPTKGPWSAFWRECYAHGIQNVPALHKELGCNGMGDSVRLKLRERFKEDSLTKVSPDRFQAWCATKRLQEVLALTEQALSKIGGIEYKWGKKARKEDAA